MVEWLAVLVPVVGICILIAIRHLRQNKRQMARKRQDKIEKLAEVYQKTKAELRNYILCLENLKKSYFKTERLLQLINIDVRELEMSINRMLAKETTLNLEELEVKVAAYHKITLGLKEKVIDKPYRYLKHDYSDPLSKTALKKPVELRIMHPDKGEAFILINSENLTLYTNTQGQIFNSVAQVKENQNYIYRLGAENPSQGYKFLTAQTFCKEFCNQETGRLLDLSFQSDKSDKEVISAGA